MREVESAVGLPFFRLRTTAQRRQFFGKDLATRRRSIQFEGSWTLIQVESNAEKSTEVIYCEYPPKRARFFSAINPTTNARRRFPCTRRNHSPGKEHYPDH